MIRRWVLVVLAIGCGQPAMKVTTGVEPVEAHDSGIADAGALIPDAGQPAPVRPDGGLSVNDVSWLLPVSNALPPLSDLLTPAQRTASQYQAFATPRVVSVRVDPCFPAAAGVCQHQVRLVAQAIDADTLVVEDSAIHLFFVFDDAEWTDVRRDVYDLARLSGVRTKGVALGVHPVLAQEGLTGAWGAAMRAFLTRHCTPARLREGAVMNANVDWRFFRFSVMGGVLTRIATTGTGLFSLLPMDEVQLQRQGYGRPGQFAEVEPEGVLDADGGVVTTVLERLASQRNVQGDIREAIEKVENPIDTPTPLIDCGVCHRATQLRVDHEQQRGLTARPARFGLPAVMPATPSLSRNNFHAFSYLGDQPAIIDRTVYESVQVANSL
ncbi:MAG: hypothetical protein GQE15_12575 [Archangiaceae bacterium]|nr:hypothetical protein [Archangiaceae bacterium]